MTGTRRQRRNAILVAGAATLLVCGSAAAGPITPLDQVRSVDGYVLVCQCQGEHMDSETAKGFDLFDGAAEARLECDLAMAVGSASQQSEITKDALVAAGRADSEADAGVVDIIHAFGHSRYTVTFEIDADVEFSLTGEISAGAFNDPEVLVGASVWLTGPGEERIIDLRIEPGPGGERQSQKVAERGELPDHAEETAPDRKQRAIYGIGDEKCRPPPRGDVVSLQKPGRRRRTGYMPEMDMRSVAQAPVDTIALVVIRSDKR